MNDLVIIILIGLILLVGFYLHIIEQKCMRNLPVSVKYPPYTNYDLAKNNITKT